MNERDMDRRSDDHVDEGKRPEHENGDETRVIPPTDTSIEPLTMMIASINAVITQSTMGSSRRAVSPTCCTVLYSKHVLPDKDVPR